VQLQNTYDVGTQITDKLGKVCHRLLRCEPIQTVAVGGHGGVAFAIVADRKTDETTSLSWYHSHLYMIYLRRSKFVAYINTHRCSAKTRRAPNDSAFSHIRPVLLI